MNIEIVAFGKIRTPGLREAANYYLKLSSKYVHLQERELRPLQVPDKSPQSRALIQEKEASLLLSGQKPGDRSALYLLDEKGKSLRTEEWVELLQVWRNEGLTQVTLSIGSSLGFSSALKKKARGLLSLGPQTLPHELARVVLYEQVFRASSFIAGHPYHVEG